MQLRVQQPWGDDLPIVARDQLSHDRIAADGAPAPDNRSQA